jgi:hypothetical protein
MSEHGAMVKWYWQDQRGALETESVTVSLRQAQIPCRLTHNRSGFGGLEVSMLDFVTQVRGLEPGRSRRIFQGEKILSMSSFGGEVKPSVPCRRFAACNRSLQWCGCRHCWQNYRSYFSPIIHPFPARGISRRCRRGVAWQFKWELPKHRVSTISL